MKYLAILKDSLREAIDNKVIYVMIALSLLVTLFVLTLSFKPLSAQKVMEDAVKGRLMAFGGPGMGPRRAAQQRQAAVQEEKAVAEKAAGEKAVGEKKAAPVKRRAQDVLPEFFDFGRPSFTARKVEAIRGELDSPESSYRVLVALPLTTPEDAEAVRAAPAAGVQRLREFLIVAEQSGAFKVKDVRFVPDRPAAADRDKDKNTVFFELTTEPVERARLGWGHEYSLFWGAVPLGGGAPLGFVLWTSVTIQLWIGSMMTLLVSLIITAFFIPNMLRKGTIDLLLVKPIHRSTLLVYKYIGGLTFIFISTAVAILGIWLALGLRSGVWANSFLLMIFVYTFFFAILYSISALFGVLTRSSIVAILATCGIWFFLFLVGVLHGIGESVAMDESKRNVPAAERSSDNGFWTVMRAMHFVLPRTSDLNDLGNDALARDFLPPTGMLGSMMREAMEFRQIKWTESITVSLVFIAIMLGLSCWRFATKDY
jgi:ABC-type transport system involved in multi-copper enzyme maturation permease subunit